MFKKIIISSVIFFTFSFSVFAESIKNYEVYIRLNKAEVEAAGATVILK